MARQATKRRSWWIAMLIATVLHVVVFLVVPVPAGLVDAVHARAVFPAFRVVLATPVAAVPFSVGEVLLGGFVLLGAAAACQGVARAFGLARTSSLGVAFAWVAMVVLHAYLLGFAWLYRRPPLAERLALPEVVDAAALEEAARTTASRAAAARCAPDGMDLDRLDRLAREALLRVLPEIDATLPAARPKRVWPEGGLMLFGISGIFWPFTQEPHVDGGLDPLQYVFVVCHELTHLAGIASEDEANFVAWLACTRSPEPFVRYAGHVAALRYFTGHSSDTAAKELWQRAGRDVIADVRRMRERWKRYRSGRLTKLRRIVHDATLKSQGEARGIASYGEMVRLIVRWQARAQ